MARDGCLARVTAGVAVGGAVGGAVGMVTFLPLSLSISQQRLNPSFVPSIFRFDFVLKSFVFSYFIGGVLFL